MISKKVKKAILISVIGALIVAIICSAGCVSDVFSTGQEIGGSGLSSLMFSTGQEGF